MTMNKIIKENYESTQLRGLINYKTRKLHFIMKIKEELEEVEKSYYSDDGELWEEVADVILVCLNMAKHYDIDIESELKKKIEKNYRRSESI